MTKKQAKIVDKKVFIIAIPFIITITFIIAISFIIPSPPHTDYSVHRMQQGASTILNFNLSNMFCPMNIKISFLTKIAIFSEVAISYSIFPEKPLPWQPNSQVFLVLCCFCSILTYVLFLDCVGLVIIADNEPFENKETKYLSVHIFQVHEQEIRIRTQVVVLHIGAQD